MTWLVSFFHLLARSFGTLAKVSGSSELALILFGVVVPVIVAVVEVATKGRAWRQIGTELFKTWAVKIALGAWIALYLCTVCATIYKDHVSMRVEIQRLTLPKYAFAPNGEYGSIVNTFGAFRFLKNPNSDMPERPRHITVTAPKQNMVIAEMLATIGRQAGCDIAGPDNALHDLAFDLKATNGMVADTVIVHGKSGDFMADGFGTDLGNAFNVAVTHDLPRDSDSIWLQLGLGVYGENPIASVCYL